MRFWLGLPTTCELVVVAKDARIWRRSQSVADPQGNQASGEPGNEFVEANGVQLPVDNDGCPASDDAAKGTHPGGPTGVQGRQKNGTERGPEPGPGVRNQVKDGASVERHHDPNCGEGDDCHAAQPDQQLGGGIAVDECPVEIFGESCGCDH